jgi:anhydro-N-acetylmuramic acid kinase
LKRTLKKQEMNVLGLMSGSSMDGLDIALCKFTSKEGKYSYEIKQAKTFQFDEKLGGELKNAFRFSALELLKLDRDLGLFFAESIETFLKTVDKADYPKIIANSGHTVYHQPEEGITVQIGDSTQIVAKNNIDVLADFRSLDVALGGHGAPLVPIGDKLLFAEYDVCINFGGICNLSYQKDDHRLAFDICPFNLALNYFAHRLGKSFDKGGEMARTGKVNEGLLQTLNDLPFYQKIGPKSLGREWIEDKFLPLFNSYWDTPPNYLRTLVEHLAIQIAQKLPGETGRCLLTGGGSWNTFFIERLSHYAKGWEIVIPEKELVDFKEATIFAFLAYLYSKGEKNVLHRVTGSSRSHTAGVLFKA